MKMSKLRVGLLSLIALVQVSTIVGGFFAYLEMSDRYWKLSGAYKELYEKHSKLIIDFGIEPNPFAPLLPLVLFGLFLTIVLLVDEVRGKKRTNAKGGENVNV